MDGKILGIDVDLFVTEVGLIVAGLAAIVGIWVERDRARPARYAIWLSVLIGLATGVGMFQIYDDDQDQKKVEADLARVLQQLDKIASTTDVDIPALNDLIKSELASQSRANPGVVENFAQRVADEGEDPGDVLASYLPEAEVEDLKRKRNVKPPANPKTAQATAEAQPPAADGAAASEAPAVPLSRKERRKAMSFGGGAPKLRAAAPKPAAEPAKTAETAAAVVVDPVPEPSTSAVVEPAKVRLAGPGGRPGLGGKPAPAGGGDPPKPKPGVGALKR